MEGRTVATRRLLPAEALSSSSPASPNPIEQFVFRRDVGAVSRASVGAEVPLPAVRKTYRLLQGETPSRSSSPRLGWVWSLHADVGLGSVDYFSTVNN